MKQVTGNTKEQALTNKVKKQYESPVLKVYGLLRTMTHGAGSQSNESAGMHLMSDRSAKENIVRIGSHPFGLGLYLFDYKPAFRKQWGQGRQFGVMADEVEKVMPEAVSVHPDGYKMVDYAMLGISRNLH